MMFKMKRYIKKLLKFIKLLVAWIWLHLFQKDLLRENIWLIREKKDEARDNGYHFFCYMRESHPELKVYYAISLDSVDLHKVSKYGNIIEADSFRHCVFYLACTYSISSQPFGAFPFAFSNRELKLIKKICNCKQKVIFLQHGIIKDALTPEFAYKKCNIDLFICTATKEYDFVKNLFKYPDKSIKCVGLARYDNLYGQSEKENIILIMPTWRRWLACSAENNIPTTEEKEKFLKSDFYNEYSKLLNDKEILKILEEKQFQLVFYLHYKLQGYSELFQKYESNVVKIASKKEFDVQDLLKLSRVLITDYSSVYFDFAYMKKPLIYYQFDKKKFDDFHYSKGYFSYEENGFGPCCYQTDDLKEMLTEVLENECKQMKVYEQRVDEFFVFHDDKNCERTYLAIRKLDEE